VHRESKLFVERNMPPVQAMQLAGDAVIERQVKRVQVPKRFSLQSREIWEWQERLRRNSGKRALGMLEHPRFRAAYDFLLLRAQSGEEVQELADWWTEFQQTDEAQRSSMIRNSNSNSNSGSGKPKRRRRRSPRKRPASPQA
jgi:poly(A) polymerase